MVSTGVLGGRWRATVTEWGGIEPWNDQPALDWHIAADDRWHSPRVEAAVRQSRMEGTAVVETKVRIPNGDAVQRVYSVPDHGGLTIIQIENASPLAIAVAFTRPVLSLRPPSAPIEGIDLPEGSVAFPIGHHATLTVAVAHRPDRVSSLPDDVPPLAGVVRGWLATTERAGRLLLPDPLVAERVVGERCELALGGPVTPSEDPVGFLIGAGLLVRMGEPAEPWTPGVAAAVERAAKDASRDWALAAALDAAAVVFAAAGDTRATGDLTALRSRLQVDTALPADAPDEQARFLAWAERSLVLPTGNDVALLPAGLPDGWLGSNFEVYGLPSGAGGTVSFAVRWHGERPAVLWEQTGTPVRLHSPVLAPQWSTTEAKGEALWPAHEVSFG